MEKEGLKHIDRLDVTVYNLSSCYYRQAVVRKINEIIDETNKQRLFNIELVKSLSKIFNV